MTEEIFHKSVELTKSRGESVTIGGGEPTLHPKFKDFLFHSLWEMAGNDDDYHVDLTTNGSNTDIALTLAKLAKQGLISCALSSDYYHDPIDPKVVEAFTRVPYGHPQYNEGDMRSIKCNNEYHVAAGRGRRVSGGRKECCCEGLFIAPDGMMYACGCRKTKLGKVGEVEPPSFVFGGYCEKSEDFETEKADWEANRDK